MTTTKRDTRTAAQLRAEAKRVRNLATTVGHEGNASRMHAQADDLDDMADSRDLEKTAKGMGIDLGAAPSTPRTPTPAKPKATPKKKTAPKRRARSTSTSTRTSTPRRRRSTLSRIASIPRTSITGDAVGFAQESWTIVYSVLGVILLYVLLSHGSKVASLLKSTTSLFQKFIQPAALTPAKAGPTVSVAPNGTITKTTPATPTSPPVVDTYNPNIGSGSTSVSPQAGPGGRGIVTK